MTDKISSEDFIKAFGGGVKHNLKRPQGDLISREALKEKLKERYYNDGLNIVTAIELIDNAPTMPLPNEQIAWEQGYEAGLAQGKQERHKGEWKVRPHIDADGDCDGYELYCSKCGHVRVILVGRSITLEEATECLKEEHKKFCFECGADMRKGDAE